LYTLNCKGVKMDSKNVKNPRLADLLLSSYTFAAKVSDIPGASIVSDNVELVLAEFGDDAEVVEARFGTEVASLSEAAGVATLDFTSAVTASDVIQVSVRSPKSL
jgi:hypothetical protein